MNRLTLLSVVVLSASVSLHAATNVKSYPASLCYQTSGPANSVSLNTTGNISNTDQHNSVTLQCPVIVQEDVELSSVQVSVTVIDENSNGVGVSCQVSGTQHGQRFSARWGTTASSKGGAGLQQLETNLSQLKTHTASFAKANLSCLLPPHSEYSPVTLVSYQVTELYR